MLPRHALRVASTAAMRTAVRRAARVAGVAPTPTPRQAAVMVPRRRSSTTNKPSSARVAARVARIAGRASDASDATAAVARQQTADRSLGSHGWSCLSAARDKEVLRREILAALTS